MAAAWLQRLQFGRGAAAPRPEPSLRNYDVTQLDPALRATFQSSPEVLTAILANLDPLVAKPLKLTDAEVNEILTFMEGG